jgi:hypothetical protein
LPKSYGSRGLAFGGIKMGIELESAKLIRLERASRTAYRQLWKAMDRRESYDAYMRKVRRLNKIDSEITLIKFGEIEKEKARKRAAAKLLIERITRDLTTDERAILRPYVSVMP